MLTELGINIYLVLCFWHLIPTELVSTDCTLAFTETDLKVNQKQRKLKLVRTN